MQTQISILVKNESLFSRSMSFLWFINIFKKMSVDVQIDDPNVEATRLKARKQPYVFEVAPGPHAVFITDPRAGSKQAFSAMTGALVGASFSAGLGGSFLAGGAMGANAVSNAVRDGYAQFTLQEGDEIKITLMVAVMAMSIMACGKDSNTDVDIKEGENVGNHVGEVENEDSSPETVPQLALYDENRLGQPADGYILEHEVAPNGLETWYKYDENWNVIYYKKVYDGQTQRECVVKTVFCETGNEESELDKVKNDSDYDEFRIYNNAGLLLAVFNRDDRLFLYTYDSNGNLIGENMKNYDSSTGFTPYGSFAYEYDENNNLVKKVDYKSSGELIQTWTYEYDENGDRIQQHRFNADGSEPDTNEQSKWEYTYDEFGRVIERKAVGIEHNGTHDEVMYSYDENGGLISMVTKDKIDNKLGIMIKYVYVPKANYQWSE